MPSVSSRCPDIFFNEPFFRPRFPSFCLIFDRSIVCLSLTVGRQCEYVPLDLLLCPNPIRSASSKLHRFGRVTESQVERNTKLYLSWWPFNAWHRPNSDEQNCVKDSRWKKILQWCVNLRNYSSKHLFFSRLWKKFLDLFWQRSNIIRKRGKFTFEIVGMGHASVFLLDNWNPHNSIHEKGSYDYGLLDADGRLCTKSRRPCLSVVVEPALDPLLRARRKVVRGGDERYFYIPSDIAGIGFGSCLAPSICSCSRTWRRARAAAIWARCVLHFFKIDRAKRRRFELMDPR
jgi:hypothetical protein